MASSPRLHRASSVIPRRASTLSGGQKNRSRHSGIPLLHFVGPTKLEQLQLGAGRNQSRGSRQCCPGTCAKCCRPRTCAPLSATLTTNNRLPSMRLPTLELLWIGSAKTLAFLIFLAVYVAVRERGRINCTDYFVAFLSVQFGPLVFAMPYGLLGEPFHPNTPAVAWSILAIMYFGLALGLGVSGGYGRYATSSISSCASTIKPEKTQGEIVLALVILFTMLLMTALYLLIPSIRSYLYDMARLVTGNWDYALYEQLRRVTYADDVAISELLARTRYSVGAALFVLAFSFWKWLRLNSILMFTGLLLFFLITASSLSKLPWITYFAYTFLVSAHLRQAQGLKFTSSRTITTFCLFLLLIYALLTLLYVVQYEQWELKDFFGEPLALASYRLFGIFYSGLLRYAEVYPAISLH